MAKKPATTKGRIFLIHWKRAEADAHAAALRDAGWNVIGVESEDGARAGASIKADLPDVVVIYLTRLPSHGRETADGLRALKATRTVPIVFVGGSGEALEKTRAKVASARFVSEADLSTALDSFAQASSPVA